MGGDREMGEEVDLGQNTSTAPSAPPDLPGVSHVSPSDILAGPRGEIVGGNYALKSTFCLFCFGLPVSPFPPPPGRYPEITLPNARLLGPQKSRL